MIPLVPDIKADAEHVCQQLKVRLDGQSETVLLTRFEEGGARMTYPAPVAHLAAAFNQMIASLRQAEAALREYSERLEEMVEARTEELGEAQGRLMRQEELAVLGNLVTSAYQAMPEGGRLTISAGVEQETVVLSVADTGRGRIPFGTASRRQLIRTHQRMAMRRYRDSTVRCDQSLFCRS